MKKAELKKLLETAEVTRDREIKGTQKDGSPKYGKDLDNFRIRIVVNKEFIGELGIGAKSESEARKNAYEYMTNPEIPEAVRLIQIEDIDKLEEK